MTEEERAVVLELRRAAGFLFARFADLKLDLVEDGRRAAGKRWKLSAVLRAALVGLMTGCKSAADVEQLTSTMTPTLRRALGIPRRLPDTTLGLILLRLEPGNLSKSLHSLIHAAIRRKALPRFGMPFHVVALDGKATYVEKWDDRFSQRQTYDDGRQAHGMVRVVNACLISTRARPVIDTVPVPPTTNEMGAFRDVFASLLRNYGKFFRLVTYDAGVPSEDNCRLVVDAGKDFLFRIKNEAWHLVQEAQRLLGALPVDAAAAMTEDKARGATVCRRVFVCRAPSRTFIWNTVRTLVRVHVQHVSANGDVVSEENKFYISSLEHDALNATHWLNVTRGHWGIENNVHWVLDAIFREDDRPWFRVEPQGVVVVMVLRRIACSLLAIFRVTLMRRDECRSIPWRALLDWMYRTAVASTSETLAQLRQRPAVLAVR